MEDRDDAQIAPTSTTNAQPRLSRWQRLKNFGFKKIFLVCVGIGVGLGIGIVGTVASVAWLTSRPIPARDWPRLEVEGAGLKAKLRTDWNDDARYQLVVTPRSDDLKVAFDETVQSNRDSISFTVHLYDKAGFELCLTNVKPTPVVDAQNRIEGLHANDTFGFECSRSNYKKAARWSLSYVFPRLTAGATEQENASTQEDDALTGFDLSSGYLETQSGNTFLVREAEKSVAAMWNINIMVGGKEPHLHITCTTTNDCLIENRTNHQAVHGKKKIR